jgi:antitoxin (DNA-binding transcriptional repressor) of toxin-antitoxin stability system
MLEAKSTLSRLVASLEAGRETEIVIARNGRAAARLVPLKHVSGGKRIGVAKGKLVIPDDIDQDNDRIAALFAGTAE